MDVVLVTLTSMERPVKHKHVNINVLHQGFKDYGPVQKGSRVYPLSRVKSSYINGRQWCHASDMRHDITVFHNGISDSLYSVNILHNHDAYFRYDRVHSHQNYIQYFHMLPSQHLLFFLMQEDFIHCTVNNSSILLLPVKFISVCGIVPVVLSRNSFIIVIIKFS